MNRDRSVSEEGLLMKAPRALVQLSLSVVVCATTLACAAPDAAEDTPAGAPTGSELLDAMIDFHDPTGAWPSARVALGLDESAGLSTVGVAP